MIQSLINNRWAIAPVALLLLSLAICTTGVTLALHNADTAEPDYYRKGAAYDEFKEQLRQNDALGWVVTPSLTPSTADTRFARLELTVADKHGIVIDPAQVTVEVVPIREAARRVKLTLPCTAPGHFAADVPLRTAGLWEFRLQISAKNKIYTDRFRRSMTLGVRKGSTT